MDKYPISVIVPTYNRSQLLTYTLDSLLIQHTPKNIFEVIVADDGSSDNTKEVVESYKGQLNIKYVYQEDKGYRPASARNLGIMNAEGAICFFVDAGVILSEDCVNAHIAIHSELGSQVAAIGYVYGFDQSGNTSIQETIIPANPAQTIENLRSAGIGLDIRERYYKRYNDRIDTLPAPWILFWTCNVSVSRRNLINIGCFDERYDGRWGCEDNDVGIRLWQRGVKIHLCRKAASIHFPHEKNMEQKIEQGYRNCTIFHQKFQTAETKIFLENYKQLITDESVDINAMILQSQAIY
ncbi:MAG TPA: glycosyltransferase [Chitinophaga sp.]|uniref:glycosyltransferase n=1 Tax=Chitinophaga sp. TaxID=1869181 RepID=UPI002F9245A3